MEERAPHRSLIEQALAARLEPLTDGASGAVTFRVHGLPEACVLKVTQGSSPPELRARARRELLFYRELAPTLPLRTPRVLDSALDDSGRTALLLAAHTPLPPADRIGAATFENIARQLAGLHATYWNRTHTLRAYPWLPPAHPPDLAAVAQHARHTWRALARQARFTRLLTHATLDDIEAALTDVVNTPDLGPDDALTLCHGDCHLGNLLLNLDAHGGLVWADWQEVRIGHGSSDLSFLIQRAEADGAAMTPRTLVATYARALRDAGIPGITEEAIGFEVAESERRTRLLYWPDYLAGATTEAMTAHLKRIFRD